MIGVLFSLAILAALAVVGVRWVRKRSAKRQHDAELARRPGYSADHPVKIHSFHEIDDAIATWRCPCGGLLDRIGEGSRPGIRVVRCACVICEEDVDLFFDLSELWH